MMFSVLYRRSHPPTIQDMHNVIAAAEDKALKAYTLTELIIKHGTKGWVNTIIDEAGPVLLHNTEQVAATLERLQKFVSQLPPDARF